MTQVSGSISLDVSKLVQKVTVAVISELTRTTPTEHEVEHQFPVPLAIIADQISNQIFYRLDAKLDAIRESLARIEQATGGGPETLVVQGPDGQELYRVPQVSPQVDAAAAAARLAEAQRNQAVGNEDSWTERD